MSPTFENKEIFLTKNFNYKKDSINRFDVVAVLDPQDNLSTLIKRVVALPNETVEIKEGFIYLNEKKLEDPFGDGVLWQRAVTGRCKQGGFGGEPILWGLR